MEIKVNTINLSYYLVDDDGKIIKESRSPKELSEYALKILGMRNTAAIYNQQLKRFVKG